MIIILASWIFILVNCYLFGFVFSKILSLKNTLSITIILGIISITTIANIFSFFGPLDKSFLFKIGLISTISLIIYSNEIKQQLLQFKKEIFIYKNNFLIVLSAILFSAYSSGYSNINDDGLYYIQTIMWLREYGLVHGISNLHLSLGLSSSWHVFQAVFTFKENINLNDVNGFLMLVFTLFIIENSSKKNINYLWFFQYLFVLIISIPFYSAPNPDFAIIVFTAICIQLFLSNINGKYNAVILLISAYCLTVKLSAITVSLLAIYVLFQLLKKFSFKIQSSLLLALTLIIFLQIGKNIYQTAYPIYPYKILSINTDWKTPEPIVNYFTTGVKTWSYSNKLKPNDIEQLKETSEIEILQKIIFRSGAKGLINKLILTSFLICFLIIIYKFIKNKLQNQSIQLHILIGLSLIIWFAFAPQYRFALPMLIFYLSYIVYTFYTTLFLSFFKFNLYFIHVIFIVILFIPTFTGINIGGNETSSQIGKFDRIKTTQLLMPMPKYSFSKMDTIIVNSSNFYHTNGNMYCWNSPLPCMSKGYEKTIYDNFKYRISLRENSLHEGFKFIKY